MTKVAPPIPGLLATAALLLAGMLPTKLAPGALRSLRDPSLNLADTERMERGYYEELLDAGRRLDGVGGGASGLAQGPNPTNPVAPFEAGPLALPVDDLREFVLRPGVVEDVHGRRWTTNRHGLRDREYPEAKPPGTLRIALLGDSIGAGWGVEDGQAFESLVEADLDARSRARGGPAVEVVNVSVPGHAPGQRWEHFDRTGWAFAPDLVLYEATPADPGWDVHRLRGLLPRGLAWDAPQYRDAIAGARLLRGRDFDYYKAGLRRHGWVVLAGVYRTIARSCHDRGVPAAWVLIPRVGKAIEPSDRDRLARLARDSGFDLVLDLTDTFDGIDPAALAIAPDDYHPNADGHARLAARLAPALAARADLLTIRTEPDSGDDRR
jgi:lysophospholipase L1-like esterase